MLELVSSGLVSLWLEMAGITQPPQSDGSLISWAAPGLVLSSYPDPTATSVVQQYLKLLSTKGLATANQGVWMQSGYTLLADHQGTTPLPAASLTKVATSLAALETWGPDHQFETMVNATGPIQNGVLRGDLVIQGSGDPFFVWEEAIALGNALNRMGIRQVAGNLIISGNFAMNFESDPKVAGEFLKQALDSKNWTEEVTYQHATLPAGTPKPQIAIAGSVVVPTLPIPKQIALLRHQSLPLAQILKQMNIYSNNAMAEMLAASVGGAQVVAQRTAQIANVPQSEILLINGSGLGPENRISPRAICAMFAALQNYLQPYQLTVADLFPVSGRDLGTIIDRNIPAAAIVKTGTLWDVSTLAGAMPTRDRGLVWFAIINRGEDLDGLRAQQDVLLQSLSRQWGSGLSTLASGTSETPQSSNFGATQPAHAATNPDKSADAPLSFSSDTATAQPVASPTALPTHAGSQRRPEAIIGDDARNQILFKTPT